MFLITQDGTTIINTDNVVAIQIDPVSGRPWLDEHMLSCYTCNTCSRGFFDLGKYSSYSEAAEALSQFYKAVSEGARTFVVPQRKEWTR